ncbi:hypothetical protein OG582_40730 (plasmid) [Streptomyces anulatus]|uniref:hypothetical protein n=1 Tax=Streptomyces anulatus TaxID=1892 RepID=UPI002E0F6EF4|nr:hypothetical protein OG557_39130 [Streptomyces anulatus]
MADLDPKYADWTVDHTGTPFVPVTADISVADVRRGIAFHEAGHAVLCMAYGMHVITTGIVSWRAENDRWSTVGNTSWESANVLCFDIAAQCAAGEVAHLRYLRQSGLASAEMTEAALADHDREQAVAILAEAGVSLTEDGGPTKYEISWRKVYATAEQRVADLWPQITAVASVLVERELTGDEAAEIAGMTNPSKDGDL